MVKAVKRLFTFNVCFRRHSLLSIALLVVVGSASVLNAQESGFNREAFEHFRNGLLFDLQGNTQEALQELMRASQLEPDNSVILKTLGDIYIFKANNYEMGAAVYEKYLEQNPFQDRTISIITQIYTQSRPPRYARLEKVLTSVINNGNDKPEYFRTLTDILLKQKKSKLAQNISIRYIKRAGGAQEASEQISDLFKNNSMVVEGIDYFAGYLKDNPELVNLGITVGMLRESTGDIQGAEAAYIDVLNKSVTSFRARTRLARMYLEADKIDNALNLYEGINFDDPEEIPVKLSISEALLQKPSAPYQKIESIMESVENKVGSNPQVFYMKGRAQSAMNRLDESVESLKRALRDDPLNIEFLYFLSQTELQRENFEDAADAISKAVKLRPDAKALYVLQGIIYDRMNDFEMASAAYQAGIAVQSRDNSAQPTLLNNYSYLLTQHDRDLDKALEYVQQALLAEPDNSSFLDTFGWVHFKLGNLQEALENIKKSIDIDPNNSEVLDHLGDAYEKMGNMDLAREYWQKALDNDIENEIIREKLKKIK